MRKTMIHPYYAATSIRMEKWLADMAEKGWFLESLNGWKFTFIQGTPKTVRYFSYLSMDKSKGIDNEYAWARTHYRNNHTRIKKTNHRIFEVDLQKADAEYERIYLLRNSYYVKHYMGLCILSFVFLIISFTCFIGENKTAPILIIFIALFLYYGLSFLLIRTSITKRRD